jgi:uncharacterized membrane protein
VDTDHPTRESQLRSVLKALTYRCTGTLTTVGLTYAVTGEVKAAVTVASIEPVLKIMVYYVHERAWQRVPIGTVRRIGHWFAWPSRAVRRRRQPTL